MSIYKKNLIRINMTGVFVNVCLSVFVVITLSNKTFADDEIDKEDLDLFKKSANYGLLAKEIKLNNENLTIIFKKNINKQDKPIKNPTVATENDFEENYWKDVPFTKEYNSFYGYDNKHTIVHLVGWNYIDIQIECKTKRFKIGAVLISPVTTYCPNSGSWDERYNVLNYEINNPSGTEEEFVQTVRTCNENRVRVIVDVVLNNMANNSDKLNGCPVQSKTYPETECLLCGEKHHLYEKPDFNGSCEIKPEDYKYNANNVRNCELKGRHDLIIRNEKKQINGKIVMFLTKLINIGVAGFRIIAASHMQPDELNELYSFLPSLRVEFGFPPRSRPFIINDVFDPFHDRTWAIQAQDYVKKGRVMDYKYALKITEKIKNPKKKVINLIYWEDKSFVQNNSAVVFLYNDSLIAAKGGLDGQPSINSEYIFNNRAFQTSAGQDLEKARIIMAAAFMFSQRHEAILITSTTSYLSLGKEIPLLSGKVKSGIIEKDALENYCQEDFICEQRHLERLIEFHNYIMSDSLDATELPGGPFYMRNNFVVFDENPKRIGFCVGKRGYVVINNTDQEIINATYYGCFRTPGKYCDIISGNLNQDNKCTGITVNVESNGLMAISVKPHSTLVLQGNKYYQ